jgi:predicted phage tail component-like protein
MYSLTVKNNQGKELKLTDNPDYIVYRVDGLTPPPATINSSVNATVDGSTINSTKLEDRNIVIYAALRGNIEASRLRLYEYFPSKKTVTLYFKNGSRDVYISGVVETFECSQFGNPQVAQISIICPDPYFKDVDTLEVSLSDVNSLFEFPFSIPAEGVEFSTYVVNNRKTIINTSGVDTGVIIKLFATGEVVNPTLYDILTGQQMTLNITMQHADTILIDTNVNKKSITLIRSGESSNILGHMRPDSKWFILSAGDNVFAFSCESGGENLNITFSASVLYSGV